MDTTNDEMGLGVQRWEHGITECSIRIEQSRQGNSCCLVCPFAKAIENVPAFISENSQAGNTHEYRALNSQGSRDLTSSQEGQRN